jgi:adenosylcobyric acid synthase
LGLLDFETVLARGKQLRQVRGRLAMDEGGAGVTGYEIHLGVSRGPALSRPALRLSAQGDDGAAERPDGAVSDDGQVMATYLHGVFDAPDACAALLRWAGLDQATGVDLAALREASLERLADTLLAHLDMDRLFTAIGAPE